MLPLFPPLPSYPPSFATACSPLPVGTLSDMYQGDCVTKFASNIFNASQTCTLFCKDGTYAYQGTDGSVYGCDANSNAIIPAVELKCATPQGMELRAMFAHDFARF